MMDASHQYWTQFDMSSKEALWKDQNVIEVEVSNMTLQVVLMARLQLIHDLLYTT
jgi:hypothetical protein